MYVCVVHFLFQGVGVVGACLIHPCCEHSCPVYTRHPFHLFALQSIKTLNEWWIGWGVFGFVIFCYFAAAKVVNFRLHRALGRDAPADEPEEEEEEEEEEVVVEEKSKEEGSSEPDAEKETMKEELQAANQENAATDQPTDGLREDGSHVEEEEEEPGEKGLYELIEEAVKRSSGLLEPPSFMQETLEEVAKRGGVSLSRSSSQGQVQTEIELSSVEQKQEGAGGKGGEGRGVLV